MRRRELMDSNGYPLNVFAGKVTDLAVGSTQIKIRIGEDRNGPLTKYAYLEFDKTTRQFVHPLNLESENDWKNPIGFISGQNDIIQIDHFPDLSKATSLSGLCQDMASLRQVNFNNTGTPHPISTSKMFQGCRYLMELDLRNVDFDKCQSMDYMFADCISLTQIQWGCKTNNSTIGTVSGMFQNCSSLKELDLSIFNLESGENMFNGCNSLQKLNLGHLSFSEYQSTDGMFTECKNLTEITGEISGAPQTLDLSACPLTNESAMLFINGLYEAFNTDCTIIFSYKTYTTITTEQRSIATKKGWSIYFNR